MQVRVDEGLLAILCIGGAVGGLKSVPVCGPHATEEQAGMAGDGLEVGYAGLAEEVVADAVLLGVLDGARIVGSAPVGCPSIVDLGSICHLAGPRVEESLVGKVESSAGLLMDDFRLRNGVE